MIGCCAECYPPGKKGKDFRVPAVLRWPAQARLAYVLEKGEDTSIWVSGVDKPRTGDRPREPSRRRQDRGAGKDGWGRSRFPKAFGGKGFPR
jgi:hypothetical protein